MRRCLLFLWVIVLGCEEVPDTRARFQVTIENLTGSEAAPAAVLSSGLYFTQTQGHPMFFNFSFDYGDGLEWLAEDGIPDTLINNLGRRPEVISMGSFPDIFPGESVSFTIEANYGEFFNFATMFVESNDLFFAFHDGGLNLFRADGTPISGDLTEEAFLWDAGTEANEEPFEGRFQPNRQDSLNSGTPTPLETVRLEDDRFDYPAGTAILRITFSPTEL